MSGFIQDHCRFARHPSTASPPSERRPQRRIDGVARNAPKPLKVGGIHFRQGGEQSRVHRLRVSQIRIPRFAEPNCGRVPSWIQTDEFEGFREHHRRIPRCRHRAFAGPSRLITSCLPSVSSENPYALGVFEGFGLAPATVNTPVASAAGGRSIPQWFTRVVQVVIHGRQLPGRTFNGGQTWDNVHIALQVGRDPAGLVPGDAATATWRAEVTVIERDGLRDFRGPAVQGKRGERFLYLTWGQVDTGDEGQRFTMFRRAKLMLDDVPALETRPATVIASVGLTDDQGAPRCGRLKPPALIWEGQPSSAREPSVR